MLHLRLEALALVSCFAHVICVLASALRVHRNIQVSDGFVVDLRDFELLDIHMTGVGAARDRAYVRTHVECSVDVLVTLTESANQA